MDILLAVDIGNTNIGFGVFRGNRLIKRFDIPSGEYTFQGLERYLNKLTIDKGIICSVVPKASGILRDDLKRILHKEPYCLGEDVRVPVNNLYRNPKQVGQDRLVNAYAGIMLYGAPLVIVDFGTAITLDVISKNKEYLGGLILPGLELSLTALAQRAALLPRVRLSKPRELIGRDTQSSILSGVVYGSGVLADVLIKQIKKELVYPRLKVIGTGGDIALIKSLLKEVKVIDLNLTLKGLSLIAQKLS